jgi:hypothetical protein
VISKEMQDDEKGMKNEGGDKKQVQMQKNRGIKV